MYLLIYIKVRCTCIHVLYYVNVLPVHDSITYWVHSSFLKPWALILVNMRHFEVQPLKRLGTTTFLQSGLSGVLYNLTMSGDISALGENEMHQWTKGSIYLIYRGEWGKGNREAHHLIRSKGTPSLLTSKSFKRPSCWCSRSAQTLYGLSRMVDTGLGTIIPYPLGYPDTLWAMVMTVLSDRKMANKFQSYTT